MVLITEELDVPEIPNKIITMRHLTTEDFQAILNGQMMNSIGLLLSTLSTGILLSLGISSLFLLSSRGEDRSLLRRNRFLRIYIIISLLTVLALDVEVFVLVNETTIFEFFSQPQSAYDKFERIWTKVSGTTMLVIVILADGVLVRLPVIFFLGLSTERCFKVWRCFMVQKALGPYSSSKWGNMFWVFPVCLWIISLGTNGNLSEENVALLIRVLPQLQGAYPSQYMMRLDLFLKVSLAW